MAPTKEYSFLDLANRVDVIPYQHKDFFGSRSDYNNYDSTTYNLVTHDSAATIGKIIPSVAKVFQKHYNSFLGQYLIIDSQRKRIQLKPTLTTFKQRTDALAKIAAFLKETGDLEGLKGWRGELFVCYYPQKVEYFAVERALSPLLGIVMYGVHINGYIPPELSSTGKLKLWIAKRSLKKPTWPGMLDNTIAGGIAYPCSIYETAVKESLEEANIAESYLDKNLAAAGLITYIFSPKVPRGFKYDENHDEDYTIQPECEYIYDLKFSEIKPEGNNEQVFVGPAVNDGEVHGFQLMAVDEVISELKKGNFKPNCGTVIIDFLMRKGIITPTNEPDYLEIITRIHRVMPYTTL